MKNIKILVISLFTSIIGSGAMLDAGGGAGTAAGLTLMEPFGARPAALGEAFSAVTNDISAFGYNPASLKSLDRGQASFMYQKGMADDSYGQFILGGPLKNSGLGLSVGYYNSGDFEMNDGNTTETVTAQKDLTMSLGYARQFGNVSLGLTGKYITSELVNRYSASAYAADFGAQMMVMPRLNVGVAVQNLGTKMTFIEEGDSLPLMLRAGASVLLIPGSYATTLLIDMPYHAVEKQLLPAAGLEVNLGMLAVRGGYRKTNGLQNELTVGAGFLMGSQSLDYSFGMVDQLNSEHRVSFSMGFGGTSFANTPIVKKPTVYETAEVKQAKPQTSVKKAEVTFVQRQTLKSLDAKQGSYTQKKRQVYVVRPGDTLGKIAKRMYGDARDWKKIYAANRHLLDNTQSLEVGQKIIVP